MAMEISVKFDVKKLTRSLSRLQRKQIPFATAIALNDTAFQAKKLAVKAMPRFIDRPTPATKRGLFIVKAKKTRLIAIVGFKAFVWEYMKYQVLGGTRSATGKKIAVPSRTARLNKYGNIPGRRSGLIKKGYFFAKAGGTLGVFKPSGKRKVKLIAILTDQATYKPRYPFHRIIERAVKKRFKPNFEKSLARAMLTAR
ncbi:MAG: hypothetical protein IIC66_11400 [candidate division Zixibacteria bacterium]|nr:hypothetical protein [candidate division Zixibacteria bacterium]